MSLIVQTLTGGNLAASGSGTAAGTSGSATATSGTANSATTAAFAQTLIQSMGGSGTGAKGAETPVPGNLVSLLQGLLSTVQAKGAESENTEVKKADLLKGLAQDMETLDANLEADPALLASLQGWLLQVAALLSGSKPESIDSNAEGTSGLSPLAQNPETLRFAVQDELNSLVQVIQDAAASGNEETASKGAALLNQFSAILAESMPVESKPKQKTASPAEAPAVALKQATGTENKPDAQVKGNVVNDVRPLLQGTVKAESAAEAEAPVITGTAAVKPDDSPELSQSGLVPVLKKTGDEEETLQATFKANTEDSEIVTAGQLSLRNGMTAPLKAESAPVPVQQFAQEMSSFISGKLEIVKKGGVAEATITLFPENLGQVDVKITMQNGNLVAQFLTQHTGTKELLEQQMNQLRMALQSQGLQVEKLEVTQNSNSPQSQWTGQQGQQAGTGGQQQDRRSRERHEDSGDSVLAAELSGEWKDFVAERQQQIINPNGGFSATI